MNHRADQAGTAILRPSTPSLGNRTVALEDSTASHYRNHQQGHGDGHDDEAGPEQFGLMNAMRRRKPLEDGIREFL